MTLVGCIFLIIFLASFLAYKQAEERLQQVANRERQSYRALVEKQDVLLTAQKELGDLKERLRKYEETRKLAGQILQEGTGAATGSGEGAGARVGQDHGVDFSEEFLFNLNEHQLRADGRHLVCKKLAPKMEEIVSNQPQLVLVIEGHADRNRAPGDEKGLWNWDLSTKRATEVLKEVLRCAKHPERLKVRVIGYGDSMPLVPDNPYASNNRRVHVGPEATDAAKLIEGYASDKSSTPVGSDALPAVHTSPLASNPR